VITLTKTNDTLKICIFDSDGRAMEDPTSPFFFRRFATVDLELEHASFFDFYALKFFMFNKLFRSILIIKNSSSIKLDKPNTKRGSKIHMYQKIVDEKADT